MARGNEFVQASTPWTLAKGTDDDSRIALDNVLSSLVRQLARQTVLLAPFLPVKAQEVWTQIGGSGLVSEQRFAQLGALDASGWVVTKGAPLFPKAQAATT